MAAIARFVAEVPKTYDGNVHFVIGNEASDADSIISAITVAHLRAETVGTSPPVIPIIACPREDLKFRPETVKLLQDVGIPKEQLVYVDDVEAELPTIHSEGRLQLTLVDHNTASLQAKLNLGAAVTDILDHHADSGQLEHVQGGHRGIAFGAASGCEAADYAPGTGMGSTCTLIAERYQKEAPHLLDLALRRLLLGVLLLDTGNLGFPAKTTPRDVAMAKYLSDAEGMPDSTELFTGLQDAKTDPAYWQQVDTYDLLRSDYKQYTSKGVKFGVASVSGGVGGLVQMLKTRGPQNVEEAFSRFASSLGLPVLMAMSLYEEEGAFKRDVILFCQDEKTRASLSAHLKTLDVLQMNQVESSVPHMDVFEQLNVASSRKQMAPALDAYFAL